MKYCYEITGIHHIFKRPQKLYSRVVYITTTLKILQCNRQCRSERVAPKLEGRTKICQHLQVLLNM